MAADVVGVDLGATKILARMIDPATGRSLGRQKSATPTTGPEAVLDEVVDVIRRLEGADEAVAVGIGVPGFVIDGRVVVRCANIVGWDSPVDVADYLGSALGLPVMVGNDVNCGALAEYRLGAAAGVGTDDLLAVFVGTGVGGGLIIDGKLIDGPRGMVGEIGHVSVSAASGPVCGCGGRGHLEAYAGRAGIERRARELAEAGKLSLLVDLAGSGAIKSRHIARALAEGDELTVELMNEAADALALVIGNTATLLDLRHIVLGGGVVDKLGQPFVDQIVASHSFGGLGADICELRLAQRLDDAGVAGAAILAADHFG
jgi:glucokinase